MKCIGNHKLLIGLALACLCQQVVAGTKPLSEYPKRSRMWMGVEEGFIRPASYEQFRIENGGQVILHAKDQQELKKGEHWATLNPEQLELERRSAALEDARSVRKEQDALQEAKDQHVRLIQDLHETQAQLANIQEIIRDGGLDQNFRKRVVQAVKDLEEKIKLLEEQTTDEALAKNLELIKEDYSLQSAQRAKNLKTLERLSKLIAQEDGKLSLGDVVKRELADAEDPKAPIWLKGNELVGSVSNENRFEITVLANGPLLSGIPTDQLLVFFQDPQKGEMIPGLYQRTEERDNGRQIQRNFIFSVDESGIEAAKRASGASNTVHVYRKFEEPCHIVLKKELVFEDPQELERAGWVGLVRRLWPEGTVVQVGSQSIAIAPPKE